MLAPSPAALCTDEKYQQLHRRHAAPFVRDVLRRFRAQQLSRAAAGAELGLGRTRFYELFGSYLAACASGRAAHWRPASSGGNHRQPLSAPVRATLRKLLGAQPPCSYSFTASEVLRRHGFALDRATVRRWALREGCAPSGPRQEAASPGAPLAGPITTTKNATGSCAPLPQAAWNLALQEKRSVLRAAPNCPWWPYVRSLRSQAKIGPDQRISIGSQRLRIERPCGTSVTRCLHPNRDLSVLLQPR
ncbi:MAG: hypothetical protein ABIU29_09650 [Chthoniobacterales bacterium]